MNKRCVAGTEIIQRYTDAAFPQPLQFRYNVTIQLIYQNTLCNLQLQYVERKPFRLEEVEEGGDVIGFQKVFRCEVDRDLAEAIAY